MTGKTKKYSLDREDQMLLRRGAAEIRQLRHENEILRAKTETLDLVAALLYGRPGVGDGRSVGLDVVVELENRSDAIA